MIFWGNHTGQPMPYRGWNVIVGDRQINTKAKFAASINKLLKWLQEYISVDTVTLLLPVENQQHLLVYATLGLEEEIEQEIRIPIGEGIAGRIALSMQPMIIDDMSSAVEVFSPILRHKGLRSLVGIPIPINEQLVGVIHVGTFDFHDFNERDVQQLELIAHRLKLMIASGDVLNFECARHHNVGKFISYINIIHREFLLNLSALRKQIIKFKSLVKTFSNSSIQIYIYVFGFI
ncbi:GAF domain-containing protein [Plectonema radiosum NIES-515]|uniref:GAF domain-containing protein n=1 Tax=Plectonema radiosum NIES-515 TaxID=2986073 RepID=A0ABT3B1E0_9CYAN|nr:GAF domain-containing protein [Plectonema radiosum]MCV3215178.1 GAF domain-containing protein [Plectonema radiosum NIES-515]